MNTTATTTRTSGPRTSALDRDVAMRLAADEYTRFLDLLRSLDDDDWSRPTECPPWDVRAVAGHTVGMALMATGPKETLRQQAKVMRRGGVPLDTLTAIQVEEHRDLTTSELVDRLAEVGPRAARGRRRTPALVRRLPLPQKQDVGGGTERWTNGFLLDTILTRDPWMHRMDIARATGRPPTLTPDHDGVIVADAVAEWAGRHGRPYDLVLDGPAGGHFTGGDGPRDEIRLDAVDFCRLLSGREADHPVQHDLLTVSVPF
jgi:uncharacterized protein (TIGR03083 family)